MTDFHAEAAELEAQAVALYEKVDAARQAAPRDSSGRSPLVPPECAGLASDASDRMRRARALRAAAASDPIPSPETGLCVHSSAGPTPRPPCEFALCAAAEVPNTHAASASDDPAEHANADAIVAEMLASAAMANGEQPIAPSFWRSSLVAAPDQSDAEALVAEILASTAAYAGDADGLVAEVLASAGQAELEGYAL